MSEDARALTSAVVLGAAVLSTGLGSAFHASAGGQLPGLTAIAIIGGLVWLLSRWTVGRRPSATRLAVAVALGQSFIHVALTAAAGHAHADHAQADATSSVTRSTSFAPGSLADALDVDGARLDAAVTNSSDPVAVALHRIAEEMTAGHAAMALGHAAAGIVVGLWLALGHRAFCTVGALASTTVRALTLQWQRMFAVNAVQPRDAAPSLAPTNHEPPRALVDQHACDATGVRGPPMAGRLLPSRSALTLAA